jgi:hypothetical protein
LCPNDVITRQESCPGVCTWPDVPSRVSTGEADANPFLCQMGTAESKLLFIRVSNPKESCITSLWSIREYSEAELVACLACIRLWVLSQHCKQYKTIPPVPNVVFIIG